MKNSSRRSFFKSAAILGGIAAIPGLWSLASRKNNNKSEESEEIMQSSILKIKPLGFPWDTSDPFLFCVHHEDKYPKGNENMGPVTSLKGRLLGQDFIVKDGFRMYHGEVVPGFPGHPHRGFETITVVREGVVDHADSMGAKGRYGNGDVQWMTAGKGIQHSEMFPLIHQDKENPLELFQIWLNLPKKDKMVEPHFKMFWADSIPVYSHTDSNGNCTEVEIVAGSIDDLKAASPPPNSWAANEDHEVAVWNIQMEPNAQWQVPVASEGVNRTLYYYEGSGLTIDDQVIPEYHAAELTNGVITLKNGSGTGKLLMLQGKPIGEPVVQHGPFVMNSKEEIMQAFQDYQKDEYGGWPWPRRDQVNPREKGRFALHADGTEEIKG